VNPTGSSALSTAGRNATITSLMVCCGFIICWSPNQMIFLLNSLGHPINFEGWFYHFASSVIPSHFESSEATSPPIRTLYWPTLSRPALSCSSAISYMYFPLHWFIILLPGYRGSITSPWYCCSQIAASTLSSTPANIASSKKESDV